VSQIFVDKEKIVIGGILIWCFGGVVLDAKWRSSLVCEVMTFMVTFGVQNFSDVLIINCEQKSGNPNDSYAITITKKPILMQTAAHC